VGRRQQVRPGGLRQRQLPAEPHQSDRDYDGAGDGELDKFRFLQLQTLRPLLTHDSSDHQGRRSLEQGRRRRQ
jgi:hypothetical protein